MKKQHAGLTALAIAASMGAGLGAEVLPYRSSPGALLTHKGKGKRLTRNVSKLQLRGYPTIPGDAPDGYFWHRAPAGRQLYYLLQTAPGERREVYDAVNDRTIVYSGWGYAKPTYRPGR